MIQGHTFDALYTFPSEKLITVDVYRFVHGLVAPMFYFSSGFAFYVATRKKWDNFLYFGLPMQKRLARFLILILLGYMLHAPFFSFQKIMAEAQSSGLAAMLQVDTLQLIGVTLLCLQLLVLILRTPKRFFMTTTILAGVVILITPFIWGIDFRRVLPQAIAAYFNDKYQSFFPVFNWSAFLMSGATTGYLFMKSYEQRTVPLFIKRLSMVSAALIAGSLLLSLVPITIYPPHDFFKANPIFFAVRAGSIALLTAGMWLLEQHIRTPVRWISIIGAESLAIYVAHLIVVYGSPLNPGMGAILGKTFSLPAATGLAIILIISMLLFGRLWYTMKSEYERPSRFFQIATALVLLLIFFINEQ